jgi:predicted MFS family arabinose efflux permease
MASPRRAATNDEPTGGSPLRRGDGSIVSERVLLFLVGAVQFVNVLDFMMIAPLGPRLAIAIGFPESHLPDAVSAYTYAAGFAGVAGSFFLERFDRRKALSVCMVGLVIATAMGGLATGLPSLLAARIMAGLFGGPATSLAIAIVSDVVPTARRGRAMGAVMGAFAVASVLGVPASIALAEHGGWRMPFFGVAVLGALVAGGAAFFLPPLTLHLEGGPPSARSSGISGLTLLVRRPTVVASYAMTATVNLGAFALIPNISAFVQGNLGLPERQLKWMYLAGGVVSFFTTRATGIMVDRFGAVRVGTIGSFLIAIVTWIGFVRPDLLPLDRLFLPVMFGIFMAFMFSNGIRNVAYSTLTTRVPRPNERARFMSIQSAVQHFAAGTGSFVSARMLGVTADHKLIGVPRVAIVSIAFALILPLLLASVDRRLRADGD